MNTNTILVISGPQGSCKNIIAELFASMGSRIFTTVKYGQIQNGFFPNVSRIHDIVIVDEVPSVAEILSLSSLKTIDITFRRNKAKIQTPRMIMITQQDIPPVELYPDFLVIDLFVYDFTKWLDVLGRPIKKAHEN